ncbi:SH3 domain-containing protein [Pseudanabaena sp. PCC 6802]|uniref:SH3 domain-containing protein n=1 Tax=Pseudanabaena sp. PCC 6802 TaxID=118173 RepID=UPI000368C03A|nr:SH3 domain-containing protein [Pseudanabaena sp. PCC 6802]
MSKSRFLIARPILLGVTLFSLSLVGSLYKGDAWAEKLQPIDEGATDPSFQSFRKELLAAARRRDKNYIFSITAPDIKYTFGRGEGLADFKKHSGFSDPNHAIWGDLIEVLALGGVFESSDRGQKTFCTPYVFCKFPDKLDAFTNVVVIKPNVPLRKTPSANAPVVETLSHDIVQRNQEYRDSQWIKITTPNNKEGYVLHQEVRSPIDYRAVFIQVNGRWTMKTFISGD